MIFVGYCLHGLAYLHQLEVLIATLIIVTGLWLRVISNNVWFVPPLPANQKRVFSHISYTTYKGLLRGTFAQRSNGQCLTPYTP